MSAYTYSLVMIYPDSVLEDANFLACAMGHDTLPGNAYTVELKDASDNRYHMCHSFCIESFAQMLSQVSQGTLPEPESGNWEDYNLTAQRVGEIMSMAIVSCKDGADPTSHVNEVLEANNLEKVV
jgi:hypothetical protein